MHRALLITEIFELICQFASQNSLARLARTCRVFKEPSVNVLWKSLESLDELIRLLPDSLFEDSEDYESTRLLQPPSREDWERMRKYTSRVITLNLSETESIQWACDARRVAIASLRPPEDLCPMFPKVKEVSARPCEYNNWNFPLFRFPWINGSSVTRFHLSLEDVSIIDVDTSGTTGLITSLGDIYPNVTKVSVSLAYDGSIPEDTVLGVLFQGIRHWNHLAQATFEALDAVTYQHISQLTSLTSLTLHLNYALESLQLDNLPPSHFPALTHLAIFVDLFHVFTQWIHPHHFSESLASLNIRMLAPDSDKIIDVCILLRNHLCSHSLQTIALQEWSILHPKQTTMDSLRPLLAFSHLRNVNLSTLRFILLGDDDLRDMASSWPLLEVLELPLPFWNIISETMFLPTFRGFSRLAGSCLRLQKLSISFDTRDSEQVDLQNPYDGVCNCAISELRLGRSPINDPERVASILGAISPCLDRVQVKEHRWGKEEERTEDDDVLLTMWEEVNAYLLQRLNARQAGQAVGWQMISTIH